MQLTQIMELLMEKPNNVPVLIKDIAELKIVGYYSICASLEYDYFVQDKMSSRRRKCKILRAEGGSQYFNHPPQ